MLQYRDSTDNKVSSAGIEVRTIRKWKAHETVNQAEGTVASGWAGLRSKPRPHYSKFQGKERQQLSQEVVRGGVEEPHCSRTVGMRQLGAWTQWEEGADRKISWTEL